MNEPLPEEKRDINVALAKAIGWDDLCVRVTETDVAIQMSDDDASSALPFDYDDAAVIEPIIERFNVQIVESGEFWIATVPGHSMRFGVSRNQAAAHAVIEATGGNG